MARRPSNAAPHRMAAPIVAGVLLIGLIGAGTLSPSVPSGMDRYVENVVTAIDRVPYRIGSWTGRDLTTAPPQAVEMLRPSRILHRGYRGDLGTRDIRLVIVHCPDARDMAGHHPPNCYPATGWTIQNESTITVDAFGSEQTLIVHRFTRTDGGIRRRIAIASGFVVPGVPNTIIPDMQDLRRVSENRRRNLLGAAQMQIIFDGDAEQDEIVSVAQVVLPALDTVADQITEGAE